MKHAHTWVGYLVCRVERKWKKYFRKIYFYRAQLKALLTGPAAHLDNPSHAWVQSKAISRRTSSPFFKIGSKEVSVKYRPGGFVTGWSRHHHPTPSLSNSSLFSSPSCKEISLRVWKPFPFKGLWLVWKVVIFLLLPTAPLFKPADPGDLSDFHFPISFKKKSTFAMKRVADLKFLTYCSCSSGLKVS